MKYFILLALLTLSMFSAQAQGKLRPKTISASQVPTLVKASQEKFFPGISVDEWKKRSKNIRNKTAESYTASFMIDGLKTEAKYNKNGIGILSITHLNSTNIPASINESLLNNYEAYTVLKGTQIRILTTNKIFYQFILDNGTNKMPLNLDESGNKVSLQELAKAGF